MKKTKALLILCGALVSFLAIGKLTFALLPYPEFKEFKQRAYSTRIYDRNGYLIQILPLEDGLRREFTPYGEIPSAVTKQFIKAEDKRFFFHCGIDPVSVARAFFQNTNQARTVSGASTISMQLARIISPSPSRTFRAKIKDSFNALKLEARLSKKQIIELYLNNVPFGKNAEGVTSSAKTYFGKELAELSEKEIECLSVIPRNPSLYNPVDHPELYDLQAKTYSYPNFFPHYINYLQQKYSKIFQQNYELQLFADLPLQVLAEAEIKKALETTTSSRINNGAVLVQNAQNGEVLCWVGSNSWYDDSEGQIDGVLYRMQPGSSMKPFLYALAMDSEKDGEKILYPSKVLCDVPKEYGDKNLYIPQNFNNRFNGPILTRIALASSLNIPAVELLNETGVENYVSCLEKMNFTSLKGKSEEYGLSLSLGGGEVSLLELTSAFGTFVRDGKYVEPEHFYKFSNKKSRKLISKYQVQVYTKDTARIICSFLSDKKARALGFGYSQSFETKYPSIFKTGTSNQFQNITALGSTKEYSCGVWMGNFNGNTVIGKTGSSLPAETARRILDYLEQGKTNTSEELKFDEPENYTLTEICALSGMKPGPYCTNTHFEYVENSKTQELCTWHQKNNNVVYPVEFQKWILTYNKNAGIDYSSSSFRIETPKNGTRFILDEQKNVQQIIPVEVFGGTEESLAVYLDEKFVNRISRPFSFRIPQTKGNHKLKVICGKDISEVEYVVE